MPLDRRAYRERLQSGRGFVPCHRHPAKRAPLAELVLRRLNGDEATTMTAESDATVEQLLERVVALLGAPGPCYRYRLVAVRHEGELPKCATMACLDLVGTTTELQLVVDASQHWYPKISGINARIQDDGRHARRENDFCRAIVFCAVPSWRCRVRILEMEASWSGSLEVGFLGCHPADLDFMEDTANLSGVGEDAAIFCTCSQPWHALLDEGDEVEWTLEESGRFVVIASGREWEMDVPRLLGNQLRDKAEVFPFAGIYGQTRAIELLP
mmetsp:Transcript_44898/g.100951  ORF Transcript_44898/g.100951 Transcript_44898/m.100951 type:complete len:270 (-) Transcript_44898:192-1001(-)|eukprot:CAMPEP_0197918530 /NCGR_PEP_ID=MMETSP1439-20131203/85628_1 /TAXON_ID=66791 /ORGANISM="Gonyaulax spinifera, Strain CCMP409" /LENGTH=269 /DNA_ID=CAMNT_0043540651 /DNA_START=94 /DNA_END=903 /DNA_ORIENTATION=-